MNGTRLHEYYHRKRNRRLRQLPVPLARNCATTKSNFLKCVIDSGLDHQALIKWRAFLNALGNRMIEITSNRTAIYLGITAAFLGLAHCAGLLSTYYFGHDSLKGLVPLFNLDLEQNIPTLFSTVLLLLCSCLLYVIALETGGGKPRRTLWTLLAGIFLFLAVDEFSTLHERLIGPVGDLLNTTGIFLYAWIIPYGILFIILAVAYSRFIFSVPPRPRRLMLVSCVLYVGGTIGFEMIGGWYWTRYLGRYNTDSDWIYGIIVTFEELLEFAGLIAFVYALLVYIETVRGHIKIRLGSQS